MSGISTERPRCRLIFILQLLVDIFTEQMEVSGYILIRNDVSSL